jgi:hypothetical protein
MGHRNQPSSKTEVETLDRLHEPGNNFDVIACWRNIANLKPGFHGSLAEVHGHSSGTAGVALQEETEYVQRNMLDQAMCRAECGVWDTLASPD